ncbi:MAG: D-galactosamine 6-phosphate deaminase/isomerase [Gammaproteobacteria bacterium]|jgi:tagatose-6-phosphate ketose/aldose isomerase|nr:D-galactosamine 6-phosphate deaminase/isomerase [Gammaproteobacteria bacterium]
MDYLGISQERLEKSGGYWTAREISQQPTLWPLIEGLIAADAAASRAFLDPLMRRRDLRIVLTGAGTSSFVGECLALALAGKSGLRVDSVATTDLVGSPMSWLKPEVPTLLVSFARSGSSPESVAALNLAEQCVQDCHHLIFTCNAEGALYRLGKNTRNTRIVLLPEETNDRGFAMTSSFSGMLLAAAMTFDLFASDAESVAQLARSAGEVLAGTLPLISTLVRERFERIVYLGSNALKGLAREAALKTLELSDGQVVAISDTPLGFRHGPKTIINGKSLVVVLLCNDTYTRRYEVDLLNELRADGVAGRVLALTAQPMQDPGSADDVAVSGAGAASDLALCLPYAAFAQSLAFMQSLSLGLTPDVPNARGIVSRVVQGVTIYPLDPAK